MYATRKYSFQHYHEDEQKERNEVGALDQLEYT